MEALEAIYNRKSIRSYTGEQITKEQEEIILKAANASPVGLGQYGSVHLTIVKDRELINEINRAYGRYSGRPNANPLYGAPELIIVSVRLNSSENIAYANAGIVVHNMSLAATALGVGHVYISGALFAVNAYPELRKKLGIPNGFIPSAALAVGVTNETYTPREIYTNKISRNIIE